MDAMRRPLKLNMLTTGSKPAMTTGSEPAIRAVRTTCVGVERSSSKVILTPEFIRWRDMLKMSSRLRQCGPLGSTLLIQRASLA
jgi:hypothetical protein